MQFLSKTRRAMLSAAVAAGVLAGCGGGGGGDDAPAPIAAGTVTTLAGEALQSGSADGLREQARFNSPQGVAAAAGGIVYVADTGNNTLRRIDANGAVTTLAGAAGQPGSVDGTGAAARFVQPLKLAVDSGGNVYVADLSAVRKVSPAGVVTTIGGLGQGAIAAVDPFLYPRLGYDPVLDLQPVSLASEMSLGLAVGPAVPSEVVTLADFIRWARRHPAAANVGSPGTGTLPHLLEAMLFHEAGIPWQHIAYGGGPPAVNALLGGQIASLVLPEGLLRQHRIARRVRVLATSGTTRSDYLPDVPSFVEQGHPHLVIKEWFAFFASSATSKETVASLSAALQEAIARPELAVAFSQAGMTAVSCSPAALSARIAVEKRYWQPVLRARGIQAE